MTEARYPQLYLPLHGTGCVHHSLEMQLTHTHRPGILSGDSSFPPSMHRSSLNSPSSVFLQLSTMLETSGDLAFRPRPNTCLSRVSHGWLPPIEPLYVWTATNALTNSAAVRTNSCPGPALLQVDSKISLGEV